MVLVNIEASPIVAHPVDIIDGMKAIGEFLHRSERWVRIHKAELPLRTHVDGGIFALRTELLDYARSRPRVQ